MLPRKHRLTADKDIEAVFKRGRGTGASGLSIRSASNKKDVTRFAFVVGTKVSKKAVIRNRLKRQMREVVHAMIADVKPGVDVVVMARKESLELSFADIRSVLERLLKKAGLLS